MTLASAPRRPEWLAAGVALVALALRLTLGAWPLDDAFISFRYADNLASGRGLVYNPGEAVLGTSTPLYTGLLALVSAASGNREFPEIAATVNALADAIALFMAFVISRRLKIPVWTALTAALLLAFSPLLVRYSVGGMETSVTTATCLVAFYLYLTGRSSAAFMLAGSVVWLRPDALALAAAMLLVEGSRRKAVPWGPAAIVLAWVAAGMLFLSLEYGEPLPQSVLAKANHVYRVDPATNLLQHLYMFSGLTLTGVQGLGARGLVISPSSGLTTFALVIFLPMFAAWLTGVRCLAKGDPRALVPPLYVGIFAGVYSLLGLRGSLMAEWYLVPLVPFWLIPLLGGFAELARPPSTILQRALSQAGPLVVLVLALSALNWGRDPRRPFLLPLNTWNEREILYTQAAEIVRADGGLGSLVAASEIGALGYACDCRILDTVGLVSPEAMSYYPVPDEALVGNYAIPGNMIADFRPEFVVTLEVFVRNTLLADARFRREYERIWEAPTDAFGSRGLLVFARKNSLSP